MDARFLSAFTDPARIKILGRFVSPFSLAHRTVLTAMESPLLTTGSSVRPIDLILAVKVCSGEPINRLTFRDSYWMRRMSWSEDLFRAQMERFSKYCLVESWPKFWDKSSGESADRGAPWVLTIVANLIANGIPEDRAWNMPESQAIWYNTAFSIRKGADLRLLTEEDEKLIESLSRN